MDYTKHIRTSYKKRGAAPAGGRAADCLSGCRRGKEEEGRRRGWWCWRWRPGRRGDGLPGMAGAGNDPAAICGGNSAVFNQLLTIFLVVAMVLRLAVFALCSYWLFRRLWRLFRSPGAWAVLGGLRGGFGGWLLPDAAREGVAEKGPVLPRIGGRVLPHILCSPPWTVGGVAENRPGSSLESGSEIICGLFWAFKTSGFY